MPPTQLLIVAGTFGPRLPADAVLAAIALGAEEGGLPESDLCPLPNPGESGEDVRALLDDLDFDARMRAAHAVVIGARQLEARALVGSVTFEIATRARQSGVPSYAVTPRNRLSAFDARILDLQEILEANSARSLEAAGRRFASIA